MILYQYSFGEYGVMNGTSGDDNLWAYLNKKSSVLYECEGDDKLYGSGRDDIIFGGSGDDSIYGLDGNDRLYGGTSDDV